jgi:hypothetical protein
MTKASQSVTYNTTLEGIEIVVNDDLKQQSLALLILHRYQVIRAKAKLPWPVHMINLVIALIVRQWK